MPAFRAYLFFFLAPLVGEEPGNMATIAGGTYLRPLEREGKPRTVAAFLIDKKPVTNGQYLAFVREHPRWRRSQVPSLLADHHYLAHWQGDLEPGKAAPLDSPVTHVSWFAARAYLKSKGKRLPTLDEWEYVARADETHPDASKDTAFKDRVLQWYAQPNPAVLPKADDFAGNFYGVKAMHGLVWEWISDFNSALATGESRADGSSNSALFCGGAGLNKNQATDYADFMRFAIRSSLKGNYCLANMGFRGAQNSDPSSSKKITP